MQKHPFFKGIDWDALMELKLPVPDLSEKVKFLLASCRHCVLRILCLLQDIMRYSCSGLTTSIAIDMQELNSIAEEKNSLETP